MKLIDANGARPFANFPDTPKTGRCAKNVLRLIGAEGLVEGDRLPTQAQLRELLGVSNNTLTPAMQALTKMGIIERSTGAGTLVADLAALEQVPWTIGVGSIVAHEHGPSAFFSHLHHMIVAALSQLNCQCRTYVRSTDHWPVRRAHFTGLEADLKGGKLDGLILLSYLDSEDLRQTVEQGVPLCHVGPFYDIPCGVVIDLATFKQEACEALAAKGCCRIVVADSIPSVNTVLGDISPVSIERMKTGPDLHCGREAAIELLKRSPTNRPDGIVVEDDYVAADLLQVFSEDGNYRPHIACIVNRQLPIHFASPIMEWELDVNALALQAVKLIRTRILKRVPADHVEYFKLHRRPVSGSGSHLTGKD